METFRIVYRNVFAESILIVAVALQVFSGIKLVLQSRKNAVSFLDKLHIYSGLYLAFFFVGSCKRSFRSAHYIQDGFQYVFRCGSFKSFSGSLLFCAVLFFSSSLPFLHMLPVFTLKEQLQRCKPML
jgi:hypothetical protein